MGLRGRRRSRRVEKAGDLAESMIAYGLVGHMVYKKVVFGEKGQLKVSKDLQKPEKMYLRKGGALSE